MQEIDIRALLEDKLIAEYQVEDCVALMNNKILGKGRFYEQIEYRDFNQDIWWSKTRQASFIESVFMGCEIPPIVVFEVSKNPLKYVVADGINKIFAIQSFLNDELVLSSSAIKKAAFLENRTFSQLDQEVQHYFCSRDIQILIFKYNGVVENLSKEEITEIVKQLYLRYNSGIRLKDEEIQKANYEDDIVTQKLLEQTKNENFLKKLSSIYFTPQKMNKTYIESTLMYCRLAITSCYAPLSAFCKHKSIMNRIDLYYRNYTAEVKKDSIVKEFIEIVDCLYELSKQDYWKKYEELHNKNFMLATFWLIFYIKKHKILSLTQFDWKQYIDYFGNQEKIKPLFSIYHVNLIDRYNAIINYMKDYYHIDLTLYLVTEEPSLSFHNKVKEFKDLPKYNFKVPRNSITICKFLDDLKNDSYILRPSYQRIESNNLKASSYLLESLFLNMSIPSILVYRYEKGNKTFFEVVDGQQRCFTLLGFLKRRYKNYLGEEIMSEKEGFSLQGLTVYSELNKKSFDAFKQAYRLDEKYINRILNGTIRIVYIPEKDNPYFSVRDYFTNINQNIVPLKKTEYRYWKACFDSRIMERAEQIAKNFKNDLFYGDFYFAAQSTINLAYLFQHQSKYTQSFSVQQVSNWLNNFNIIKSQLMNAVRDNEVDSKRQKYYKSLEQAEQFLTNLVNWLNRIEKSISEVCAKHINKISFTDLLCIYYLIGDMSQSDLLNNAMNIYEIILEFFENCADKKLKRVEKIGCLGTYKERLGFFLSRTIEMEKFKETLLSKMEK